MNSFKNNNDEKWLDDLLGKSIGSEKVEPDFEKWRQNHPQAVEMLISRANRQYSASICPLGIWRTIMKSSITKLAAAAVIIIAVTFATIVLNKSVPTASAAQQILTDAIKAVSDIHSVYIKAKMRTLPQDNFAYIGLALDFVPLKMWKRIDENGLLKWRIEKPLRVVAMDGKEATLLIRQTYASRGRCPNFECYDVDWCGRLMNVENLLDSELQKAKQRPDSELCLRHENINGKDKLVLEIETLAQGDYTNDYIKNKFIFTSDNMRVYHFDAETKLLEGFEIYVHSGDKDVLVFETTDIQYNPEINDNLFTLELPKDIVWNIEPQVLPDNEKYAQMGPKETAQAFFKACAEENWDEFLKYWSMSKADERIKRYLGGLEIISLGEPFKSGRYPGWLVPYEVKLKYGEIKKHNLAVRNDNPAKRYIIDGGI